MTALVPSRFADCIEACRNCLLDCQVCLAKMATKESMNDCPLCCLQCIDVLQASIGLMIAESTFSARQCALCAEVCDYCADQCEQHDHEHCRRCAESCRRCAAQCRAMAN